MAGEIDALAVVESDLSTQRSLDCIGLLKELSVTDFTVSSYETKFGEENHNDVKCLPVVTAPTDNAKESDVENCIQQCPSLPCQETLESPPVDESLGNCIQENEQRDDKSVSSPFEEGSSGVVEEESDVTPEIKDETLDQKLCIEGDACGLKEDSPEIPHISTVSCWPVDITENSSFGQLDVSRLSTKAVFDGVSPSSAAELYEQKDNEGKDIAGNSSPPGLPNSGLSFSPSSSRVHNSSHKLQPKRPSRKSKKKAKVQDLHIFMVERKRRTCFSKPARSSNWGLLGNLEKCFQHSDGMGLNKIPSYEPSKRKLSREGRKRNKSRAGGSSQGSRQKKTNSTSGIRLKVKLGKEVCRSIMVSDAFYSSAFAGVSDFETKSLAGTGSKVPNFASDVEDKAGADLISKQLQCFDDKLGEAKVQSDTSILDLHLADKDLEGTGDVVGDCLGLPSNIEVEGSEAVIQKRYTDPGTSPDSEVINSVPDSQANTRSPENSSDTVLPSKAFAPALTSNTKRGKMKDSKAKTKKKQGSKKNKDDGTFSSEILTSSTDANASSNSSSKKDLSEELSNLSSRNDIIVSREASQAENGLDAGHNLLELQYANHLLPSQKSKKRLPKKSCEASKGRSKVSDKAGNNREKGHKQRVKERKSVNQKKKEKNECGHNCITEDDDVKTGSCIVDDSGKIDSDSNIAALEAPNLDMASSYIAEQHIPDDNAWVRCDDCYKWRRIPVALVDSIGQTNCQWICKDNTDKAFGDCSIPQEKSSAEINAELGISDADEEAYDVPSKSKGVECKRPGFLSNEHEFTLISSNQFLHRNRKRQTIDEIMVCHCKSPLDGRLGCGDECLNRMLNIECVQGTCPCGDRCSNQQFQKRNYVKMKWERCGKKGFGLRSEEDISKGHFLIEYVGEVLDMHTYEARQREYAFNSHKHFYFMTLNGSEVIDACAKGNLGRFINHSCDPNCRTEKWVVSGEICIGLFALRDIKKGEEVTFDYNYVRVFGAAAKKCYCGSSNCRGYIGGDPTSTEVIDQVDSDEEFLEPVMLEDGKTGNTFKNRKPRSSSLNDEPRVPESISKDKIKMDHPEVSEVKLEDVSEIQDAVDLSTSVMSQLNPSLESDDLKANFPSCQPVEMSETSKDIISESVSANHEIPMEENKKYETSSSDGIVAKLKSKSSTVEEKRVFVKSRFLIKTSRDSSSLKKGKVVSNASRLPMLANKSQMLAIKPKKFMNGTSNGRLESVEEKLNELLDVDGGISKRKDAAKGYLKFLVHTAASGASGNGEAIQSNRDLSIILDALLKTKSRAVLVDIINKNGLRMLHNMIKQYRKDFKKTPILRKLLKVLEYLAGREIIVQEHINGGPPCPGMESFRDSILSLTEHDDKQVHQIARNFRDRWIPRHMRRHVNMDRDDRRMDFQNVPATKRTHNHSPDLSARPSETTDFAMHPPKPSTPSMDSALSGSCANGGTKGRKRKSRWDQPAPQKPSSATSSIGKNLSDRVEKGTIESYCPNCAHNYGRQEETSSADSIIRQNIQIEAPPGFSPMLVSSSTISNPNDGMKFPVGYEQKKFNSRHPVSYGIPLPIMQRFGKPPDGNKESWDVAPGMPFHPFPPLPPFPTETRNSPAANSTVISDTTENPSTTDSTQPHTETRVEDEKQSFKRARASRDLGTGYYRQQKWNKAARNRDRLCSNIAENVRYEQQRNAADNGVNRQNITLNY